VYSLLPVLRIFFWLQQFLVRL